MKIFLDTAEVELIKPAYETGLIDGVTTNPSLILKSGRQLKEVITEISESFPKLQSISAEVVGDTADEMEEQVHQYYNYSIVYDKLIYYTCLISNRVTIKVPCTIEGLKLCKRLSLIPGINTNVTLVFSVAQAILAAKAGATYISPFVGRLEDQSFDGLSLIKSIREVYDQMGTETKILAASIRDVRQVEQCAKYGADVVTVPPLVFWKMYKHAFTESGLAQFNSDYLEATNINRSA
jgi:transaldolase